MENNNTKMLDRMMKIIRNTLENDVCTAQFLDEAPDRRRVVGEIRKALEKAFFSDCMKTKKCIIEGKAYTVEHVFNMVGNWYFTDKHGIAHLVDGEDISEWLGDREWKGADTAIAYARELARDNDGCFWWKTKVTSI